MTEDTKKIHNEGTKITKTNEEECRSLAGESDSHRHTRNDTDMRSRDLPRHAAVDEGNAADQNGTGPRAALICRIPLIHRPGSARPQTSHHLSSGHGLRLFES